MLVEVREQAATLRRVLLDFERGVVLSTGSTAR
jgi:hypothetical protein